MSDKIGKEVRFLVSLLDDPEEDIRQLARKRLYQHAASAIPYLNHCYLEFNNIDQKDEIFTILRNLNLKRFKNEIKTITDDQNILILEKLAFRIAQLEYPLLNIKQCQQQLDQIAENIRVLVTAESSELEMIQGLNDYLFKSFKLKGNSDNYYDPQNSYLNRVLDRKKGIPLSLSLIYMFVAYRLGLRLLAVGLPGHFILTPAGSPGKYFIDPFNNGNLLGRRECMRLVQNVQITFEDSFLDPVGNRYILLRMLRNLINAFKFEEDIEQMSFYENLVSVLRV